MLRLVLRVLGASAMRSAESKYGTEAIGRAASFFLLAAGAVFIVVWLAFFTGPLEFEQHPIHVADVAPINGGPTLRLRTDGGESYRLVDDIYQGKHVTGRRWRRDDIAEVLRSDREMTVWVIPGRRRVQGLRSHTVYLDPEVGYRVESGERFWAPILPALLILLGLSGLVGSRTKSG